jgi:hypothetical protein
MFVVFLTNKRDATKIRTAELVGGEHQQGRESTYLQTIVIF